MMFTSERVLLYPKDAPNGKPSDINDMLQRLWPQANAKCLEVSETQALASCDVQEGDYRPVTSSLDLPNLRWPTQQSGSW